MVYVSMEFASVTMVMPVLHVAVCESERLLTTELKLMYRARVQLFPS
jgi:hypothetical protein